MSHIQHGLTLAGSGHRGFRAVPAPNVAVIVLDPMERRAKTVTLPGSVQAIDARSIRRSSIVKPPRGSRSLQP
jgi:hypothetical protein